MKQNLFFIALLCCISISAFSQSLQPPIRSLGGEIILSMGVIFGMEFTPDGKYLILIEGGGKLFFINMMNHRMEKVIHSGLTIYRPILNFSPDLHYVLIRGSVGRLIDLNSNEIINTVPIRTWPTEPFSKDNASVYYYKEDYTAANHLYRFNVKTHEEEYISGVNAQLIDSNEKKLIGFRSENQMDPSGLYSVYLDYWSLSDGSLIDSIMLQETSYYPPKMYSGNYLEFMSFGPDDDTIVGVVAEIQRYFVFHYTPYLWNAKTGEKLSHYKEYDDYSGNSNLNKISWNKRWLAAFTSNQIVLYDLTDSANTLDPTITLSDTSNWGGAFYPDSKQIFYIQYNYNGLGNDLIKSLNLDTRESIDIISLRVFSELDISFSPDGKYLIFNGGGYEFDIWNAKIPQFTQNITDKLNGYGTSLFAPDSRYLIRGVGTVAVLYDTQTWQEVARVKSSENDDRDFVNVSSRNQFLTASGNQIHSGTDNVIRVWDTDTREMLREIHGHTDSVWYADFSPDGRRIISASLDGTAKVWDVDSGNLVANFVQHATGVTYAAFFPDGQRVLSAGIDRRAFVWNADTAQIEKTFMNLHTPVSLSPDGKYLFAGSEVWDMSTGERINILDGTAQDYTCLSLSPDGTQLLTSESSRLTKIWSVPEQILPGTGIRNSAIYH